MSQVDDSDAHSVEEGSADESMALDVGLLEQLPMQRCRLQELRPTQLAVGMQQVREKEAAVRRKRLAEKPKKQERFLCKVLHRIPAIKGPLPDLKQQASTSSAYYIVDHHHLALALMRAGVEHAYVAEVEDLSSLSYLEFWQRMAKAGRVWRYGPQGSPLSLEQFLSLLPASLLELPDDPYRSLAALVRKAGGYLKSRVPYSEFLWANYLRQHVCVNCECQDPDAELCQVHLPSALRVAACVTPEDVAKHELPGKS